ncbi:hypothetical protein ACH5RR_005486 [Cinchona calisaya]|uniref:Phosphoglycerate kinase n=1 Tax=Cinchona calisaya TaxID=153742 RepID=A0ABD3AL98_9GENT
MTEATLNVFQCYYYFRRHPIAPSSSPFLSRKLNFPQEYLSTSVRKKYCRIEVFSDRAVNSKLVEDSQLHSFHDDEAEDCEGDELNAVPHVRTLRDCEGDELNAVPHVRTLREFPKEELFEKVVMVRFDSKVLLHQLQENKFLTDIASSTIKYLFDAGAKVILVSSWGAAVNDTKILASQSVTAEVLSSILGLKVVPVKFITRHMHYATQDSHILLLENLLQFKEEPANCKGFAKLLSSGVDIFVNDTFSKSHRALASTVGVSCFCYASIAGFYFEAGLSQLKKLTNTSKRPYVAIVSI